MKLSKYPLCLPLKKMIREKRKEKKNGEEIELRFCIYIYIYIYIYILFLKKLLALLKERKFGYVVKNEKRRKEGIRPKIGLPITLFHESMHEY